MEELSTGLREAMAAYEWGDRLPRISTYELSPIEETSILAEYETEGGQLRVAFLYEDGDWVVGGIGLQFVKGWRP